MRISLGPFLPAALVLLTACGQSPSADLSTPTTELTTDPASSNSAEGLMVVDATTGDLLRMQNGEWALVFDGPSYNDTGEDEIERSYVESATSLDDLVVVVGLCCEPVVGALVFADNNANVSPMVGYGTRPMALGRALVSFLDEYEQDRTKTRLAITGIESATTTEYDLLEVDLHGQRIMAQDGDIVLAWAKVLDDKTQVWRISQFELDQVLTRAFSPDLTATLSLDGPVDLAASLDGKLYFFSTSTDRSASVALHEVLHSGSELSDAPVATLLPGVFSVAVRNRELVFQATVDGVFDLDGQRITPDNLSPAWIGW